MTKLAPEWVRTCDPVIRSPARHRWTTAPARNDERHKASCNWEKYRTQRNYRYVTKIRKENLQQYITNKCKQNDQNGYEFWKTIKPIISDNCKATTDIILM